MSEFRWRKQGRLFEPAAQAPWIGTHAALPVVHDVGDRVRVYLSSRDASGRSHIGFIECDGRTLQDVVAVSPTSVVAPGDLGAFDDAGVTSACVVTAGDQVYLYYTGWSLGTSVPFYLNIGLAISDDGGRTFRRWSQGPLLDRNAVDPFLLASPWILRDGDRWRMWYVSGSGWDAMPEGPRHRYHIRYAESADGIRWDRSGTVCIDYQSADEYAFGRPCVVRDGRGYRMWYCYRGDRYRIGYAESGDGVAWIRKDAESGIELSDSGWDAEMMAYPVVSVRGSRWYMLYNGNGYGRTGVGLATRV